LKQKVFLFHLSNRKKRGKRGFRWSRRTVALFTSGR